ncbi:MAG: NAD(P)H-dependent oxidoreductase [Clostridia bacterium]|nr:NAD(P)H-dependent oxidoreductase [Clostridia bacterium]
MKILVLMGSPRLHSNTAELCKYFMEELKTHNAELQYVGKCRFISTNRR